MHYYKLNLNNSGNSISFFKFLKHFYSRSSSKYGWHNAFKGENLIFGSYFIIPFKRSIRSGSTLSLIILIILKSTFFQSLAAIFGNLNYFKSYFGFIAITYYYEGVPKTFIISISWSKLLSAMKIGLKISIYNSTQPTDHISILVVYYVAPNINSGAL